RIANRAARFVLDVPIHDFGCGLKAYRSTFIKDFRLLGDAQASLPAIAKERGARVCEVVIAHHARDFGASKTNIPKMMKTGFDLLSAAFFIRYFSRPLRFFGGWGVASIFLSLCAFGAAVILRVFGIEDFTATPLPVVGTLFAILGVLLFMMGLLAEILLPIYYATTHRSPYAIREVKENK
ncbi:MAG: glycosyltransferase, partial [Patescibacteria group bacterium]